MTTHPGAAVLADINASLEIFLVPVGVVSKSPRGEDEPARTPRTDAGRGRFLVQRTLQQQ